MNNFDALTRFLLTCAGADLDTMALCTSSEVNKYRIMGTCVLIPSVLALFSGGYTMYLVSGTLIMAFVFAPIWSFVIFTLDRAVVSTTRPGKVSLGVLSRIFLAVVIAFTISEPVILRIFSDAIEDKRVTILNEKQINATSGLENRIAASKQESKNEKGQLDELNHSYIQEVDGTGGSKTPYRGPIAEVKWQAYQKAQKDFDQNELIRANDLKSLEAEKADKLRIVSDKDAKGFLGNMRILGRLMDEDSHVLWCVWMVRMLFLCIELVPVFIKMGTSSDMDPYGTMKDMNDRNQEAVQKELVEAKSSIIKTKQLLLMQVEKYQIAFEDTKAAMNSSTRTYEFFLEKIKTASEQKMKAQLNLIEKVKDETLRAVLMGQIDQAYDSYIQTLEALIQKTKQFHTSTTFNS
jgi:hypothetical protein